MIERIQQTAEFLKARIPESPLVGIITGTGLSAVTEHIAVRDRFPYEEIPHFPVSTVEGHKGNLLSGTMRDKPVLALEGRFHLYEGYRPQEITFPVRVMAQLGVRYLLIASATGGLNPRFETGDLMLVADHINLTGCNALNGPNLDPFGPRFPDMTEVYDSAMRRIAKEAAMAEGIWIHEGVYAGVAGPSLETPAETRFLRAAGADAVGMSTVQEAIVAAHCGLRLMATVVITNMNLPDCMEKASMEKILETAQLGGQKIDLLWGRLVSGLDESTRVSNPLP